MVKQICFGCAPHTLRVVAQDHMELGLTMIELGAGQPHRDDQVRWRRET